MMAHTICHRFNVETAATTEAVRNSCGGCGGDLRQPISCEFCAELAGPA